MAIEMKLSSNRVVIRTSLVLWLTSKGCVVVSSRPREKSYPIAALSPSDTVCCVAVGKAPCARY